MKKRFWLILLAVVFIVSALAVTAFAAGEEAPSLTIKGKNVSLESSIWLNFRVIPKNVPKERIELLVWTAPKTNYVKGTENIVLHTSGTDASGREVFIYKECAAKNMTETFYIRAYANVNGQDVYSDPDSFSIVGYSHFMTKTSQDAKLKTLLTKMMAYGAEAQVYFNHHTEYLATDSTCQIGTVGATLQDGMKSGFYKAGTALTVTADAPAEGMKFSYFTNSAGAIVGTKSPMTYTINQDDTLTAVYQSAIDKKSQGLAYRENSDGQTCAITGIGTCTDTEIYIPKKIEQYRVTSIGHGAFENCTGLTSVTIGNSVTSIDYAAFGGCTGLTAVTIPDSVTKIGGYAFNDCTNLTSITIPDGVTSIGYSAFLGCRELTTVTIPDSVTSIGYAAFSGCSGLASMTVAPENPNYYSENNCLIETRAKTLILGCKNSIIPNDVTSIDSFAFEGITGLTEITIPDSVTSIGDDAFHGCTGLTSVAIGNGVTSINRDTFRNCTNLISVTIPNGVTSIGDSAFSGCTGLTSITIPDSVTSIGKSAFYKCNSLATTRYDNAAYLGNAENPYVALISSFSDTTNCTIHANTKVIASLAIAPSDFTILTVPAENTRYYSEGNCIIEKNTKTLIVGCRESDIPQDVTSIGDHAFSGCTGLTSVTIPNSVTSICNSAFSNCSELTSVTIPNGVTSIGVSAFWRCSGLTSVTIPDSVTSIGYAAFGGCSGLASITVASENSNYYSENNCIIERNTKVLIAGCNTSIIPQDVTGIGNSAFYGCTGLTSVTIGNGVTSIDYAAFSGCTGLTSVTIPDGVTSIGGAAFEGCTGLTSVTIGNGVKNIYGSAFKNCSGLTSVTIPNGVTSIGDHAFSGCTGLTSVTIPDSLLNMGRVAFDGCYSLKSTVYDNAVYLGNAENPYVALISSFSDTTNCTIHANTKVIASRAIAPSDFTILTVPAENTRYYSEGNCIIEKNTKTLIVGCNTSIIPQDVTSIGDHAFYNCTGLTSVTIPNSVTSIGYEAFGGCSGLTSITIPDGVTSISAATFSSCRNLKDVILPKSLVSIKYWAYRNCDSIKAVYYYGTESDWANIKIESSWSNKMLLQAPRYYYSETQPTVTGNYWHYVDGVPTKW